MHQRIAEIDYLKGVMIILVVMFHLVALDIAYPTVRMAVYTFHVSVFLIISGYLTNINKNPADYGRSILRLIVPYIICETVYMLLLHLFGDGVNATLSMDVLTLKDVAIRLLVYPVGAYWYLQVLIVCGIVYYLVFHFKWLIHQSSC
ncbi:Acyltransferase family protein [Prevotella sp. tc2-28]|uniref:acyltransferase family protein n=1 Tax=Prevotella sp. tc2-28 TaxID=1761888 RepID=UPI0008954B19|nr:Acyltransferase family protein [Prevotella sp. tc2-28]